MQNIPPARTSKDPGQMDWDELLSACAQDRRNSPLWAEFLGRYGLKIKQFIRGTWSMLVPADDSALWGRVEQSDLFQSTIVRLVEQDCAALRRFSGTTEEEWLAYLAVITRSVVRDFLRRRRAIKRPRSDESRAWAFQTARSLNPGANEAEPRAMERKLLAREVTVLCERAIHNLSGESSTRDMLVFQLYFLHDLTARQIAQCRGVNLSKAGVEKLIDRLKDRIRSVISIDSSEAILQ